MKKTLGLQIRYHRNKFGIENTESYFDVINVREYRRVIGTLAFPFEEMHGCIMLVAESANKSERLGRSYYILNKYSHINFDSILKKMVDLQNIYHVKTWYTNTNNNLYMHLVDSFNLCRPPTKMKLNVQEAPFAGVKGNLTLYTQQIKNRLLQNKKTLFLGDLGVSSDLRSLKPEEVEKKDAECFPNVCCLCYAVSQLDQVYVQEGSVDYAKEEYINRISVDGL